MSDKQIVYKKGYKGLSVRLVEGINKERDYWALFLNDDQIPNQIKIDVSDTMGEVPTVTVKFALYAMVVGDEHKEGVE